MIQAPRTSDSPHEALLADSDPVLPHLFRNLERPLVGLHHLPAQLIHPVVQIRAEMAEEKPLHARPCGHPSGLIDSRVTIRGRPRRIRMGERRLVDQDVGAPCLTGVESALNPLARMTSLPSCSETSCNSIR